MPTWGIIATIAGTGTPGYSGDNGQASRAELSNPFYCAFDAAGNLFIAESGNNTVRRVDKTGRITTVAGSGRKGYDGDGGPAVKAAFNDLVSLVVAPNGDLYLIDRLNSRVRYVEKKSGMVTTVLGDGTKSFGGDNGPGTQAEIKEPHDAALDNQNGLLVADVNDCRVRRLDIKSGTVTTWAGTGKKAHAGDGGPKKDASFAGARAIATDKRDGTVYICEREGNAVRRVDGKTGRVTTIAGTGTKGYTGDNGPALLATFNGPKSLCCDADGNLYVVDTENHAVRCVDLQTGIITTVAGGHKGADGDNGQANRAGLLRPHGAVVGPDGSLYIADSENHRVRRVSRA